MIVKVDCHYAEMMTDIIFEWYYTKTVRDTVLRSFVVGERLLMTYTSDVVVWCLGFLSHQRKLVKMVSEDVFIEQRDAG